MRGGGLLSGGPGCDHSLWMGQNRGLKGLSWWGSASLSWLSHCHVPSNPHWSSGPAGLACQVDQAVAAWGSTALSTSTHHREQVQAFLMCSFVVSKVGLPLPACLWTVGSGRTSYESVQCLCQQEAPTQPPPGLYTVGAPLVQLNGQEGQQVWSRKGPRLHPQAEGQESGLSSALFLD